MNCEFNNSESKSMFIFDVELSFLFHFLKNGEYMIGVIFHLIGGAISAAKL